MTVRPDVITAIESAVANDPTNIGLRLHLSTLLTSTGRHAEALGHCHTVLASAPDDPDALECARSAADSAGDLALAARYARLLTVLGPRDAPPGEEGPAIPLTTHDATDDPGISTSSPSVLRVVDGEAVTETDLGDVVRPRVTLADVGGMDSIKQRLELAFLGPMRNPQLRQMYGKSLRGGLLLYGPPGCGKTFVARATAGELGAHFFAVGLSDVLDMWLGMSEKNIHEVFQTARRHAPCVLFFDEIDALGQKRAQTRNSGGMRNVIAQLLSEMDNVDANNDGVFVLAATNHPWDVDSALRRPGRFDRLMVVLPPDAAARSAIFAYHLRDRPVARVDLAALAQRTDGFSGADIAHICETAAERALHVALTSGTPEPISMADLRSATADVPKSTDAWFQTAKHFAMFSNEGGLYDDLIAYMKAKRLV